MTSQIIICMAIFAVTLISYMLNKIPMWVTAMLSMAALYITGCIDDTSALSGFANNNTILMATMFMVAAGFRRTSLVETMCNGLLRLTKGSFQKAYVGYLLLSALLTNFISSPMVVYAIVSPLMAALCDKVGLTITSTHASIQNDPANEEAVMERWRVLFDALRTMGAKYCIMPGYAFGSTLEEIAASCDYCNRVGKLATEYGLKLGYHNHAGDFVQVEGQTVLDYVLAHTDPELFLLELDVASSCGIKVLFENSINI